MIGSLVSWLRFNTPIFICLDLSVKRLNYFLMVLGFLLFLMLKSLRSLKKILEFLGRMWFLVHIVGLVWIFPINFIIRERIQGERGWLENYGTIGLGLEVENLSLFVKFIGLVDLRILGSLILMIAIVGLGLGL